MPMTIIEKILARASGQKSVGPGDLVDVDVDTVVLFDSSFFPVDWRDVLKVFDPDKLVVAFDHRIPAPNRACAEAQVTGRAFVKRFGIKRFLGLLCKRCHVAHSKNSRSHSFWIENIKVT